MDQNFSALTASMKRTKEEWVLTIPESWMQGRTTYGGLSSALCLQAVFNQHDDLPPLRSAQINFVGPVGGEVIITSSVMRRGKSVAFISAEMVSVVNGERRLATHAVFCFGTGRPSKLNEGFTAKPNVPGIAQSEDFFRKGKGPSFTQHFECLLSKGSVPMSGADESEFHIWVRHKDKQAKDLVALLALADMPPPAVLPLFKEFAPISSMTWMMNFLTEELITQDGWWLMRSAAEHARDGYSSQDMQIWNSDGELAVVGRQNIAIFY